MNSRSPLKDVRTLEESFIAFTRAFSQYRTDRTPSGLDISLSEVYALTGLLCERGITASDLGKRLELHKSTISRLVARLVERGWVERRPCTLDGRARALHLSPEGVCVAVQIALVRGWNSKIIIGALHEEELPTVLQALTNLVTAMERTTSDEARNDTLDNLDW